MKMQRFLIFLLLFIFIPCTVCAEDLSSDKYNEALSDYDLSFFEDSLDKDAVLTIKNKIFRTRSGINMLENLYLS